jgi:arylsulfatase A-like enzyme/Flp pilus assembly protein TadD
VLIVIDTLRADHLGCYGSPNAHTPNLDALAARGVRFTDAMTPVPVTLPATASLLTGLWPFHSGVRDNEHYVLSPEKVTLAERLQAAGWWTGAVVASSILSADRGLDQGFEVYDDHFQSPYPVYRQELEPFADELAGTRRRADTVTDLALARLEENGDEPFFLFVHYFDVHSYYDPPPAYAQMHPDSPYDGEVSFVDAEIGRLLEGLEGRDDALVVVVSDHGEGLGEHGESEHGFFLYQSTLHVPVLAAGPGVPEGVEYTAPMSLIDLEPTLAGMLDLAFAGGRDGRRLEWEGEDDDERPLYAETCRTLVSYHWSELRALRQGQWKLITGEPVELYDLSADPGELESLGPVAPAPEMTAELERLTGGETRADIITDLSEEPDPGRRELLESLGYIGGDGSVSVEEGSFPHPRDELANWLEYQEQKRRYRIAVTLASRGRYEEAIALFDTVLVEAPDRADVYYNRAVARRGLGDEAAYLGDLESALRVNPDYVPALQLMAQRREQQGSLQEAYALWTRVYELDPSQTPALQALATRWLKQDQPAKALPYLRQLVQESPEDPTARFNLGLAAWNSGNQGEAREHLELFLQLAPGDPRASSVREMLGQ